MRAILVLAVLVLSLGAVGCNSSKKASAKATSTELVTGVDPLKRLDKPAEYDNKIVLRLERTSCFGTCPVYTIVIYEDGTGIYEGRTHANLEGQHGFKLDNVQELLDQAKAINYMGFDDVYEKPVSDFPTCYTYVRLGKERKQIRDYRGAPAELKAFEKLIDERVFATKMSPLY